MSSTIAVVLAAGRSTRMKSDVPKVLHPVCGRPMIEYVLDAARAAGAVKLVVVVGHRSDLVRAALSSHSDVVFAEQTEQKGTGHAVMVCEAALAEHTGPVLILAGDTPLLRGESLKALLDRREELRASCVIGTARTQNNEGLGRIVRDSDGRFLKIVEQKDASAAERQITEINTGCYAFSTPQLLQSLRSIRPNNSQGEYYLTDCPRVLMDAGQTVEATCSLTLEEALGVNTRTQLAEVRGTIQQAILKQLMLDGVTIEDPAQTSIEYGVVIGRDTVIRPFTVIERGAVIGEHQIIGPFAHLRGTG
ncbi:MAG: Bifunctional protein GlmU [Planctomycetota bacterium]|jgi:bifunctional UDP-N-acetylglucosamine pyrophosphorylase/glucosamine-1-phosphate N-acetyltransferase